jgi:hypothetical protein
MLCCRRIETKQLRIVTMGTEATEIEENSAVGGRNELLVMPLYPLGIENIFSNVERVEDDRFQVFRVRDENGSDAGMMTYMGKNEWRVFVDNFPCQKKYFSTNLPINTVQQFIDDISRTGLGLELIEA